MFISTYITIAKLTTLRCHNADLKSFLVSYLNCLLITSKVPKEHFTKCIDVTSAYSIKLSNLQASGNFWYSETLGLSSLFGVIKKQHEPELNAYTFFTLHPFQCQVRRRHTKSLNSWYVMYGQARFSLYAFSMYTLNIETESHNCFFPYPRHTIWHLRIIIWFKYTRVCQMKTLNIFIS